MQKHFSFTMVGNNGFDFNNNNVTTTVDLYETKVVVESVEERMGHTAMRVRTVHLIKHITGVQTIISNNGIKENIILVLGLHINSKAISAPATETNVATINKFVSALEALL